MPSTFGGTRSKLVRSAGTAVLAAAVLAVACAGLAPLPGISTGGNSPHIPGKFVWHALLTDDAVSAQQFYGELFGWSFEPTEAGDYVLIRSAGRAVGAILEVKEHGKDERITQWLSFLSVSDVDAATAAFEDGGTVHRGPVDVPGLGRVALVADPLGAPLIVVRSATGDPPDGIEPAVGEFLWTDYVGTEPNAAADFYGRLVGWEARPEESVTGMYWVMWHGDHGRAGMFENPWSNVKSNWLPYVRVADTAAKVEDVKRLGGEVVLAPSAGIRNGSTAVVLDAQGAALVLQSYPF